MGHIFINVNSTGPPPAWNRTQNAQKYLVLDMASQPSSASPPPTFDETGTPVPSASLEPFLAMSPLSDPNFMSVIAGGNGLNNTAEVLRLFLDLYYRRYRAENTSAESLAPGNECGGWRSLLPYWLGQSPILDTAIKALAISFIGTQYQDEAMMNQARNSYLSALQMVQQVLKEPNSTSRKDLLATTLVMSSIELFMSNGAGQSQLTHIEGATRLLNSSLGSMDLDELHVYILNQGLFEAISNRHEYLFSSPSYNQLVRQIYSIPRTNRNDLYFQWCELILPLPNILHATDNAATSATTSHSSTLTSSSSTLSDLTALENSLAAWYEMLKSTLARPWTFSAAQANSDSVPFPLQFTSIEACTNYCLYWSSQLLLLEARQMLYSCMSVTDIPEQPVPSTLPTQMSEYASLVCRSIQFCTSNTSFAATENLYLPLDVVTGYYLRQGDHDRMNWCVGAFSRISYQQKIGYAVEKLDLVNMSPICTNSDPSGVWDQV